ncbi:hypothetical protein TNCV_1986561 [Trichonephila clavipes]|nr:hypothetical protein TNCV_1986561 [Trichonephila clavipes]
MGWRLASRAICPKISPKARQNGEGGRSRNSKRSNEAERRRGGKNAGRQSGRLKAVTKHTRTQYQKMQCRAAKEML